MGISARIETVTPEKAEKWLGSVAPNRNLRKSLVERHAESMRQGEWQATGESVKFDKDGRLLDGQHRLHAIVEAGISVEMLVVRGLDATTIDVLDTGIKRTLSDVLSIHGEGNVNVLASTLIATIQLRSAIETGRWPVLRGQAANVAARQPTHIEALQLLEAEPEIRESVRFRGSMTTNQTGIVVYPTVIAAGHYALTNVDPDDTEEFFRQLKGIEVKEGSAIYNFRKRFMATSFERPNNRRDQLAYLLKTWNFWRADEWPSLLSWKPGGKTPEKFPIPK
jgi:hypothetical protein